MNPTTLELYGGDVVIEYHENSHRYYLVKEKEVLSKKKMLAGASTIAGLMDKSRMLIPWAIRSYTEKVVSLMGNGVSFTKDDVMSMLAIGEKAHDEESMNGKEIGTYLHAWAEEYAKDQNQTQAYNRVINTLGFPRNEITDQVHTVVKGLHKWLENEEVEIEESEGVVYSMKEGFTGRFDATIIKDGKRYLVDYKTSNGIYDEHRVQASAYLKAKEEEAKYIGIPMMYHGALIVSIAKKDKEKDGVIQKAGTVVAEYRSRNDLVKDYKLFKSLVAVHKRQKELAKK